MGGWVFSGLFNPFYSRFCTAPLISTLQFLRTLAVSTLSPFPAFFDTAPFGFATTVPLFQGDGRTGGAGYSRLLYFYFLSFSFLLCLEL